MAQEAATPLQRARLGKGLTLLELATECTKRGAPVSEGAMSRIDRGHTIPRPKLRSVLAGLLDLDITDFTRTDEPTNPTTTDDEVQLVRNAERAVQDEVPELPDTAVEREAS